MKLLNAIRIFWFVLTAKANYRLEGNSIFNGDHSFKELYDINVLYFAAFAMMCYKRNMIVEVSYNNIHRVPYEPNTMFIVNIKLRGEVISAYYSKRYFYLYSHLPYTDTPKYSNETLIDKDINNALTKFIRSSSSKVQ